MPRVVLDRKGNRLSGHQGIKDIRVQIRSAGPPDSTEVRIHADTQELFLISQGSEDAVELDAF
jgi:hypothetical protein